MKKKRSRKYKNYGPIPQNEYITTNTEKKVDSVVVLGYDPQPNGTMYKRRLKRWQAQHPSGRSRVYGWARSWKANGWRNELASQYDEVIGRMMSK